MEYLLILSIFFLYVFVLSHQNLGRSEELICSLITVFVFGSLIVLRRKRLKRKCKKCKKNWALKLLGRSVVRKEDISILVELKNRNYSGQLTGTSEQYIPGTRTTYEDVFQCKYCGNKEVRTRKVDEKKV